MKDCLVFMLRKGFPLGTLCYLKKGLGFFGGKEIEYFEWYTVDIPESTPTYSEKSITYMIHEHIVMKYV